MRIVGEAVGGSLGSGHWQAGGWGLEGRYQPLKPTVLPFVLGKHEPSRHLGTCSWLETRVKA